MTALADLQTHRPCKRVARDLSKSTDREFVVESIHAEGGEVTSFSLDEGHYYVFVDEQSDVADHLFVHETLHAILIAEGYVIADVSDRRGVPQEQTKGLLLNFTDCIHHVEIFRRMNQCYRLPMEPYFQHKQRVLQDRLDDLSNWNHNDHVQRHQVMLTLFDCFLLGDVGGPIRERFQRIDPDSYRLCERAAEQIQTIDLTIAENSKRAPTYLRDVLIQYCNEFGVTMFADFWSGLGHRSFQNDFERRAMEKRQLDCCRRIGMWFANLWGGTESQ